MSEIPNDDGMSETPFEDPDPTGDPMGSGVPGDEPIEPSSSKAYDLWGLRSDTPNISPQNVGEQLDLGADWWEHMMCGLLKQSGSDVAEAWQHHIIAMVLLADSEWGILDNDDREEIDEETGAFDEVE